MAGVADKQPVSTSAIPNHTYHQVGHLALNRLFENGSYFDWDFSRLLLGSIYAVLSSALFANLAVALLVIQILMARNQGAWENSKGSFNSNQNAHILVYILALSVVDAVVLTNAGVVSSTIFYQRWIFSKSMCTAYYAIDSVNKTLSTFILTSMSLDRFLAIRYSHKQFRLRSFKGAIVVLVFCLCSAFILLLPVYLQTDIIAVPVAQGGRNETTPTCAFVGEADYAVALAIFGFLIPLLLMCFFYTNMLMSLRRRRNKLSRRALAGRDRSTISNSSSVAERPLASSRRPMIRIRTVTKRTLFLVLFHFGCWSPYWLATFYVLLGLQSDLEGVGVIAMYVVHIGTYLNSAVNPILYALLNRDLRRRRHTISRKRRRRAVIEAASVMTD